MVGRVLTSRSSMTLGLVSARYAFALRASPALPWTREEVSGVSVVLTWQSLCFCLAVHLISLLDPWSRLIPQRLSTGLSCLRLSSPCPPVAFRYHTAVTHGSLASACDGKSLKMIRLCLLQSH